MTPKLVIVTDLGLFKAYRLETTPRGTPRLVDIATIRLEEAHHRIVEQVRDLAGQRGAPTNTAWGAPVTDDHNLRLELKRRLIRKLADHVQHFATIANHDAIWIAVPAEIHHALLEELPNPIRSRVEKLVPRDLVKLPKRDLIETLVKNEVATEPSPAPAGKPNHNGR